MGEFELIERLVDSIGDRKAGLIEGAGPQGFRLRVPIGDDASAWDEPSGTRVLTTDTMVEGVHFNLETTAWADLGWKLLAVNMSDVAAMGCAPLHSVVTLGLRGDIPVDGLVEMYRGMMEACRRYGGAIVGGDIVRSPVFFVSAAMTGVACVSGSGPDKSGLLLRRDRASPGDRVGVTGSLGCSAGGLRMLTEDGARRFDAETAGHLSRANNRPEPRVPQGQALAQHGVAAAMDISDGLVDDLRKMCEASGVGARIYAESIPVDETLREAFAEDWLHLALTGGEDYELLFTAPQPVMDRVAGALDVPVTIIGEIVAGPPEVTVLDAEGRKIPIGSGGWDHLGQASDG